MGPVARREFPEIEEVAEVIGPSAGDKFLGEARNLHKLDVPDAGMALNLVPPRNAWNWHVEDHSAARNLRITANERIGPHPSDVAAAAVDMLQFPSPRKLIHLSRPIRHVIPA